MYSYDRFYKIFVGFKKFSYTNFRYERWAVVSRVFKNLLYHVEK